MRTLLQRLAALVPVALLLVSAALPVPAEARRVALVIGNSEYRHVDRLLNPVNDATEIGRVLGRLGFDKVMVVKDAGNAAMSKVLQTFEEEANGADVALLYYAGHGIEVDGQNYLIPVDARLARRSAVDFEAIELSKVTKRMEGAKKLRLVILDACRNNPFRNLMMNDTSGRRRSIGRGLGAVNPGENELIAFAAAPGTEADDGDGRHSPFTTALVKHMETPGLEINQLFREVRDEVLTATRRTQTPHVSGTLGREQIFLNTRAVSAGARGGQEFDSVRKRLEELESRVERQLAGRTMPAPSDQTSAAASPRPRDDASVLLQQLQAERARADQALRTAEEERRRAEAAQRLAALPNRPQPPAVSTPVPLTGEQRERLSRDVQGELKRVGCYSGNIDGRWGEGSRLALGDFSRSSGRAVDEEPSPGLLELLRSFTARVCPLRCEDGEVARNGQCVEIARPARRPPQEVARPKVDPRAAARERAAERAAAAQKAAAARERAAARQRTVRQRVLVERRVVRPVAAAGGSGSSGRMCFSRSPSTGPSMVPCSDPRAQ